MFNSKRTLGFIKSYFSADSTDMQILKDIKRIIGNIIHRFFEDQCLRIAASLSFTTLLSLVPLLAVSFAIFAAFPAFNDIQHQLQDFVFQNFVPSAGDVISEYFTNFTQNAGKLTALGITGLAVTAIMLLATIENCLNRIFRVQVRRSRTSRLLIFWALLTMGPLLIGMSLSLSTYYYALSAWFDVVQINLSVGSLIVREVLPNLIMMLALTIVYIFVPNRSVNWQSGVTGGILAGILFSILKKLFALFVSNFTAYQTIYGVLASIPIFLVWMYLAWTVVLIGALTTAVLDDPVKSKLLKQQNIKPAERMAAVLYALHLLRKQQMGGGLSEDILLQELGIDAVDQVMKDLQQAGYCMLADNNQWLLARDLNKSTLDELYRLMGFDLTQASYRNLNSEDAITVAEEARLKAMHRPLSEVV